MSVSRFTALAAAIAAFAAFGVEAQSPADTSLADAAGNAPVSAPEKPVTIPFELQDNLVRLPVDLNGGRRTAVLDSGTGAMLLNRNLVDTLGLREERSQIEAAGSGSEASELHTIEFSDLTVGPLRFKRLAAFTADLHHLASSAGFPIDLLLGAAAFTAGTVTVDYPHRTVTFGESGSAGQCAKPIPLTILHGVPIAEVEITSTKMSTPTKVKLLVDLGTRHHAVMLWGGFLQTEAGKALTASGTARRIGTGIGGKVNGIVASVERVRIGKSDFGSMIVALDPAQKGSLVGVLDGTLGVPLWKAGRITFDYPAKTLCIEASRA